MGQAILNYLAKGRPAGGVPRPARRLSARVPLTVRAPAPARASTRPAAALASDEGKAGPSRPPPPPTPPPRPPPPQQSLIAALEAALLPRARGDARDCALMAAAVAGLVWASMGATRAYCAAYDAAGLKPLGTALVDVVVSASGGLFW